MRRISRWLQLPLLVIVAGMLAGCITIHPGFRPALPPEPAADPGAFTAELVGAIVSRNYARLQAMMGSPFVIAGWEGQGEEVTPEAAAQQLEQALTGPAAALTFVTPEVAGEWLGGADPLSLWPPEVQPVSALGVSGLGADGAGQAVLIVAQYPDGNFYWYAMLLAPEGFPADGTTPGMVVIVPPPPNILPTDVQQVLILGPVGIFDAPSAQSNQVGTAVRGQTFPVVGVSADGQWWAVVCPAATNTCWINVNPTFVRPVRLPAPRPTSTPAPVPPTATPKAPTPVPQFPIRILFGPGQTTTSVSGLVGPSVRPQYLFDALAGQNVRIVFESPAGGANFAVRGVADGATYKSMDNPARSVAFVPPTSQDFLIDISSPVNRSYRLQLTVDSNLPPPPTPTPPPPPLPERITFPPGAERAVRSGPLYANTPKTYLFRAETGQTATIRLTSPSSTANFSVVGASDGIPYKSQGNSARQFSFVVPTPQDYLITILGTVNTSYTLELIIPRSGPTPVPTPERIRFAPGSDAAVRSGTLPGGSPKQYIFNARTGQTATIHLDAPPGSDASFSVRGVFDGVIYKAPGDLARQFTFVLPRTQDYLVTISASGDTSYTLTLIIPPVVGPTPTPIPTVPERISFAPGADTAVRSGPLDPSQVKRYVFGAQAGQVATIQLDSPSPAANFTVVGVSDGIPYKSQGSSATAFTFNIPTTQDYLISIFAPVNTTYTLRLTIPPILPTAIPPTETPTPTPTGTPTPPTATPTGTPEPPTPTPTGTPEPPTATPTDTPDPPTPTPTGTPEPPTATPTGTPEPPTATPTDTPEPPTATPTDMPEPPTATPTDTPEPPTATPTDTPEPPTATPTDMPEPPTATPTDTPEPPTPTPTETPIAAVILPEPLPVEPVEP